MITLITLIIGSGMLVLFLYFQNNALVISKYNLQSERLPDSFDDFKIVHLSDLHNKSFGSDQTKLVQKIKNEQPDMLVFTGDLIDSRRYNAEPSIEMMEQLVQFVPVYYVPGNHESNSGKFAELEEQLLKIGVHVLRNEMTLFSIGNDSIAIIGLDDPTFEQNPYAVPFALETNIEKVIDENGLDHYFNVVLSHRPEEMELYAAYQLDVVFTGHAHGGQIRLPFIGGILAPNQGFFPDYTSGTHTIDETTMVVSRGLGNSLFPFRVFNRPEIVVVTLEK